MREAPDHLTDVEVLTVVRTQWDAGIDDVEYLPVGFGAHHWAAHTRGGCLLFVTFDGLAPRHTAASLEDAYAAAAALAGQGWSSSSPRCRQANGRYTAPLADGALSAAPWRDGTTGVGPHSGRDEAAESARMLARLHAATPPAATPPWAPLVPVDFADDLARRVADPWVSGPYGERARLALQERLDDVTRWTACYHRLAAEAGQRTRVATHGEPHTRNQLRTATGPLLVDWESLKLGPKERDFATLLQSGLHWLPTYGIGEPDWSMVEMFDLEWRLDEISSYADWLAAYHSGNESDAIAVGGLLDELARPGWRRPG